VYKKAPGLLLVAAIAITFFMGFFVGSVLPPHITANFSRGQVSTQHIWIKPTADTTYVMLGNMEVVCMQDSRAGTICFIRGND
jgi:hypothetical protein